MDSLKNRAQSDLASQIPSALASPIECAPAPQTECAPAAQSQKLFDAEMRLAILRTKLGDALGERDGRQRRKQPTRMIETIIEIMQGDIARTLRHLDELRGA